jgi:arabinofuranosyltransferase
VKELATDIRIWVIPALLLVVLAGLCFSYTADDAFISFRYARNLAAGEGLVFNPGERVEGFSNLAWVLLMAVPERLGADTVVVSKVIGIVCALAILFLVGAIARRHLGVRPGLSFLGLCYLATSIGLAYYSISGLETVFFGLAVLLVSFFLLEQRPYLAGLACGLVVLTRPEGVLFLTPLALGLLLTKRERRETAITLAIPFAVLVGLMVWKLAYYGAVLPNTHYAKVDTSVSLVRFVLTHTRGFLTYTVRGFAGREVVLALAFLGALAPFRRKLVPLIASVFAAAAFVWYSGGDWMAFARFYVPVLPILVIFWIAAVDRMEGALTAVWHRRALVLALVLVPLGLSLFDSATSVRRLARNREYNPAMTSHVHASIGRYLGEVGSPSDRVVVNEVGAIAYYSDLHVVDMLGLTDRDAARLAREGEPGAYADYILSFEPRFVLVNDRQEPWDTEFHPLHGAIHDAVMATGQYRLDRTFELNYYKNLLLFVREGSS